VVGGAGGVVDGGAAGWVGAGPGGAAVIGGAAVVGVVCRGAECFDDLDDERDELRPLDELDDGMRPDVFSRGGFAPGAGISPAAFVTSVTAEATIDAYACAP
jgi:hypothetical protein